MSLLIGYPNILFIFSQLFLVIIIPNGAFGGARERESNANAQNQLYTTVWFVSFLGGAMEGMVKKYQQKFRKVRDETKRWDELQSRLLSQFRNASSIIERLQVSLSNPTSHF